MSKVDPPFDEDDRQAEWSRGWLIGVLAVFTAGVVADVVAASGSVFLTLSYLGAYYLPRAPWLAGGIVGLFGAHMAMPHDFAFATGYSMWIVLGLLALYALVWHGGQLMGWWSVMGNAAMWVNLNVWLALFYVIWPMRPTW